VLTIETANQPGILAKIAERLADAKVNIEYTYLAAGRETEKGLIILRAIGCRKSTTRARGALGTNLDCRAVRCNPP
jgi:hypothetical protein